MAPSTTTDVSRRRARPWLVLVVLASFVLLAACNGFTAGEPGGDPASAPSSTSDEPDGMPTPGAAPPTPIETPGEPSPGEGNEKPPPGGGTGESPGFAGEDVARFSERCAEGVEEWRAGQLDFPSSLVLRYPGSATYNAAVDAREVPVPADEVIDVDEGSAGSQQVLVQCRVGARLVAVDEHLTVVGEGDDDWTYKEWNPLGVLEWSWSVTAEEPADAELRLDLRPAVVVEDVSLGAESQLSVTSDVDVRASAIQAFGYWVETEWAVLWGGLVVLGGAFFALRAGLRKLRKGES